MTESLFQFRVFRLRDIRGSADYGLWNEVGTGEGKTAEDALGDFMERHSNAGGRFMLVQEGALVAHLKARRQESLVIERAE